MHYIFDKKIRGYDLDNKFIPYSLIADPEITGFDLTVFCYLQQYNFAIPYKTYMLHTCNLSYLMKAAPAKVKRSLDKIILSKVLDNCIINSPNEYIINTESIKHINNRFIILPNNILNNILISKYTYKYDLVKLILIIIAERNIKNINITNISQDQYMQMMGISSPMTITKYQSSLEALGIISITRKPKHYNIIHLT